MVPAASLQAVGEWHRARRRRAGSPSAAPAATPGGLAL